MKTLAIDPASMTGWASNDPLTYGTWDCTIRRDESDGMRIIRFKMKLAEACQSIQPDIVVFERPGGRNTRAIITQSEIIGIIKAYCILNNIAYRAYSSQEIKKYATGKGNSNKKLVIEAAQKKLGYQGSDDNEADALWLLELSKRDFHWET